MSASTQPAPPLSAEELAMLDRLDFAAAHGGVAHVAAPNRQAALRSLARRGLATCWDGEGRDAGLVLGRRVAGGRVVTIGGRP